MSALAANLTSCRRMTARCSNLFWRGNRQLARVAGATALADRAFPPIHGPGEKAYEVIFVGKNIVRHQFLPHIQRGFVARAIAKVPGAIESCKILVYLPPLVAYSEKNALFGKVAVGHLGSPLSCWRQERLPRRMERTVWHCTRARLENIWGKAGKAQWGKVGIFSGDQVMPRTLKGFIRQRFADS